MHVADIITLHARVKTLPTGSPCKIPEPDLSVLVGLRFELNNTLKLYIYRRIKNDEDGTDSY